MFSCDVRHNFQDFSLLSKSLLKLPPEGTTSTLVGTEDQRDSIALAYSTALPDASLWYK